MTKRPKRKKAATSAPAKIAPATIVQRVFGLNLRRARDLAGLTQADLAGRSGKARSYISAIEDGQQNLTFSTAESLARAVGRTVHDLLSDPERTDVPDVQPVQTSGALPAQRGNLSVELPAGQAFEVAVAASKILKRPIPLIDPSTRIISGVVPRPADDD